MSGRTRLPAGASRKASQKRIRRAEPLPGRITPQRRLGDRVSWGGRVGSFMRALNDGEHAEIRSSSGFIGCGSAISGRGDVGCCNDAPNRDEFLHPGGFAGILVSS